MNRAIRSIVAHNNTSTHIWLQMMLSQATPTEVAKGIAYETRLQTAFTWKQANPGGLGQRMVDAFTHAIELCGGMIRKEPF